MAIERAKLVGGREADLLLSEAATAELSVGKGGDDELQAGDGDFALGGKGNDRITITSTNSAGAIAFGGRGDDTITGGDGDDLINGDFGTDTIEGGAGGDTFYFHGRTAGYVSKGVLGGIDTILDFDAADGDVLHFQGFKPQAVILISATGTDLWTLSVDNDADGTADYDFAILHSGNTQVEIADAITTGVLVF